MWRCGPLAAQGWAHLCPVDLTVQLKVRGRPGLTDRGFAGLHLGTHSVNAQRKHGGMNGTPFAILSEKPRSQIAKDMGCLKRHIRVPVPVLTLTACVTCVTWH